MCYFVVIVFNTIGSVKLILNYLFTLRNTGLPNAIFKGDPMSLIICNLSKRSRPSVPKRRIFSFSFISYLPV